MGSHVFLVKALGVLGACSCAPHCFQLWIKQFDFFDIMEEIYAAVIFKSIQNHEENQIFKTNFSFLFHHMSVSFRYRLHLKHYNLVKIVCTKT